MAINQSGTPLAPSFAGDQQPVPVAEITQQGPSQDLALANQKAMVEGLQLIAKTLGAATLQTGVVSTSAGAATGTFLNVTASDGNSYKIALLLTS